MTRKRITSKTALCTHRDRRTQARWCKKQVLASHHFQISCCGYCCEPAVAVVTPPKQAPASSAAAQAQSGRANTCCPEKFLLISWSKPTARPMYKPTEQRSTANLCNARGYVCVPIHDACGVVWCGVVWCGVVWCGVVWCGAIHCIGGKVCQHMMQSHLPTHFLKAHVCCFRCYSFRVF